MDFSWEKEHIEFRRRIVDFARDELNENTVERERSGNFPLELWKKCADFGIQGLATPKRFGGSVEEVDILTSIFAMEGFGYGCRDNGLAFALNAQMWTVQLPILRFGSEDQKSRFLPRLTNGEWVAAHALTEPKIGSDAFSLRMSAEKIDDGYILNGKKCLVSLAPVADVALVFANVNPGLGKWGVTAFLVEAGTSGLKQGKTQDKMGLRTVPIGELEFENCFVPDENRLGREGAGFSISNHSLEYERCSILASQLGAMERQLDVSIKYVTEREQFGKPIGKFQSVSNRIAEMKLRLETSKLLLYKVAWLKKTGKPAMLEAALLKLHLSESYLLSSLDAIRNHGGIGYLTKTEIERDMRDAVGGLLYAGTSDIQRNIIAKLLGL